MFQNRSLDVDMESNKPHLSKNFPFNWSETGDIGAEKCALCW